MTEKTAEEWAASLPETFPLWLLRDVIASAMTAAYTKGRREMAEEIESAVRKAMYDEYLHPDVIEAIRALAAKEARDDENQDPDQLEVR